MKCTAEKEGAKEGVIYNKNVRGYFNERLINGMIFLKRNIWFCNWCTKFNNNSYWCKHSGRDCFATNIYSLVHHRWHVWFCCSIFVFLFYFFLHNNHELIGHKIDTIVPVVSIRLYKVMILVQILYSPYFIKMIKKLFTWLLIDVYL